MINIIVSITEENPQFTLAQINAELRRRLPQKPNICDNSVAKALDGRLITLKIIRDAPVQRNSPETKTARMEMANWLLFNTNAEKVCIDESGFHLQMRRSVARSARGQPAFRVVNARQSKQMSTIFAVSNEHGLVHHAFKEGGFNAEAFKEYLEQCSLQLNRPVVFIFDNAPSHNSAVAAHLQVGHSYRFQPPYSPFMNIC